MRSQGRDLAARGARAAQFHIVLFALAGLVLFPLAGYGQESRITGLDRHTAKIADVVRATGGGLGASIVDELYLTNASQDIKIAMIEQSDKMITFKIPAAIKAGRWALMIHLKAAAGTGLFEQPIKVTVE